MTITRGGQCSDLLGGAATISLYSDIVRVNLHHKHRDGLVGSNMTLAHTHNLGFLVYAGSFAINWIAYFTIYDKQESLGPLWLTIPIPLILCLLTYFAWEKLG